MEKTHKGNGLQSDTKTKVVDPRRWEKVSWQESENLDETYESVPDLQGPFNIGSSRQELVTDYLRPHTFEIEGDRTHPC